MTPHVLITGGSGFIGSSLCALLLQHHYSVTVLTRSPDIVSRRWQQQINVISDINELPKNTLLTGLINLAGAPILDRPWTTRRKALLRKSRIAFTTSLLDQLHQRHIKPAVIISGSAIGYYGDTGNEIITESESKGKGFAADLCDDWEQAAIQSSPTNSRVCILRTGVVLGLKGGMLAKTHLPFRLGLGGKLGSGQQWLSWIDIDDICRLIVFLLETDACHGAFNATAPHPITNRDFTFQLGNIMNKPTWLTTPSWVLKILLGKASSLLLDSQRILPNKALSAGFQFQRPTIQSCLAYHITKKNKD